MSVTVYNGSFNYISLLSVFNIVTVTNNVFITSMFAVYGKDVKASDSLQLNDADAPHPGKNTVTYEARQIKAIMLQLV